MHGASSTAYKAVLASLICFGKRQRDSSGKEVLDIRGFSLIISDIQQNGYALSYRRSEIDEYYRSQWQNNRGVIKRIADSTEIVNVNQMNIIKNELESTLKRELGNRKLSISFYKPDEESISKFKIPSFHFDTVGLGPDPMPRIISFMETVKGLVGWLQIKEEPIGTRHRIDLYLPVPNRKKHVDYAYGVSEEEILDICFYQGIPDSSRPGIFFQLPNAYQSFNLLMMDGLAGEKIRIGKEHQRPNSIYIRNWKMTLAVFRNVFSAMCKCQYALSDGDSTLHRMDRRLNVEQMYKKRQTIAFTSTTKVELLSKFLEGKNEPVVETLRLQEQIPNFDFQQILKEDYTFTDEAEVLLPPFVKIKSPFDIPLKTSSETFKEMPLYLDLNLGEMAFPPCYRDKNTLIQVLNQLQDKAAETLDYFVSEGANTVYIDEHSCPSYILWKQAFQELVALEFFDIYKGVNASFKRKAFK